MSDHADARRAPIGRRPLLRLIAGGGTAVGAVAGAVALGYGLTAPRLEPMPSPTAGDLVLDAVGSRVTVLTGRDRVPDTPRRDLALREDGGLARPVIAERAVVAVAAAAAPTLLLTGDVGTALGDGLVFEAFHSDGTLFSRTIVAGRPALIGPDTMPLSAFGPAEPAMPAGGIPVAPLVPRDRDAVVVVTRLARAPGAAAGPVDLVAEDRA
ncbi:MAG: hypothetical protein GVY28_10720 [Alphaproteobacteria bacterium]|jgi:hypothetical protein|nr:hypothetical protein [Alphaproteobacteria bacterium]